MKKLTVTFTGDALKVWEACVKAKDEVSSWSQRDLAEEFEVAESTVSRWANGIAVPHPSLQALVVKWIWRKAAIHE